MFLCAYTFLWHTILNFVRFNKRCYQKLLYSSTRKCCYCNKQCMTSFPLFKFAIDWTISILKHVDIFLFSAPSSPRNVQLLSVTDTSIKISWWEPARANGVLLGYRVYFLHRNFTSVQTIRDNKSAMVETLTRLSK